MTDLENALDYLEGARFANYSGQIVEQKDGKDRMIVCELGCACGEVGPKNAEEYAEVLITLLNSASLVPDLLATLERLVEAVAAARSVNGKWFNATPAESRNAHEAVSIREQEARALIGKARGSHE